MLPCVCVSLLLFTRSCFIGNKTKALWSTEERGFLPIGRSPCSTSENEMPLLLDASCTGWTPSRSSISPRALSVCSASSSAGLRKCSAVVVSPVARYLTSSAAAKAANHMQQSQPAALKPKHVSDVHLAANAFPCDRSTKVSEAPCAVRDGQHKRGAWTVEPQP